MCFFQVVAKLVKFEQQNYASAGAIANEVLSAIRTVAAFGGEGKAVERWAWLQSGWGSGWCFVFVSSFEAHYAPAAAANYCVGFVSVCRYDKELVRARGFGILKSFLVACLVGLLFFILFACYALAFG